MQIAVFLLYAQAAVTILFGEYSLILFFVKLFGIPAGYGIANERKWGYGLGLIVAFAPFVVRVLDFGLNHVFGTDFIALMFEIALVLLLLHPQSREYERIWFK